MVMSEVALKPKPNGSLMFYGMGLILIVPQIAVYFSVLCKEYRTKSKLQLIYEYLKVIPRIPVIIASGVLEFLFPSK